MAIYMVDHIICSTPARLSRWTRASVLVLQQDGGLIWKKEAQMSLVHFFFPP